MLVTDTKRTWAEGAYFNLVRYYSEDGSGSFAVLTRKEVARRWRHYNHQEESPDALDTDDEETWRSNVLDLLTKAHTLGWVADLSFEVVESNYSVSPSLSQYEKNFT